ncbi:HTH-type transcriptional regulator SlrR [Bacillus pumilus]|uniref:HTH-type transcriptional regulator SlrR n=1 Tax=Bacillus pumilus TaxID=1408 RepID=UPI0022808A77|nr:helix-turn-helix domain-containing protein [Bacillus pumilus]MCY7502164.1 helix-turn-helix domain-containing protein [Bacillus pumilus]MCY7527108.1 helix-turn-helix domain-containing protein [Bacillus pumilus]MED4437966.1 helix-turn-helix domain-containing protein [Bacillus pumilus]MED4489430.1 helix-turn-helix domain-containing protein [Bacillus pumilus]
MIGKVIRIYRKRKGYSIQQLAEDAHVSKSYLSKIERGVHRNPSIQFLKKVSSSLEIDLQELFDAETLMFHDSESGEHEWREHIVNAVQSGMPKEELYQLLQTYRKEQEEKTLHVTHRKLTDSNITEWKRLMSEAKAIGLSIEEVKAFLANMGERRA